MLSAVSRLLLGEDMFVSYARADGAAYAVALATRLSQLGFEVYLDQFEPWPSPVIPARIRRPLLRSSMLVVVATPRACSSPHVAEEIRSYVQSSRGRSRSMNVIDLNALLREAAWFPLVDGLPILPESNAGEPSDEVVSRLERAATYTRLKRRQLGVSILAIALLALAALATGLSYVQSVRFREDAQRATARASSANAAEIQARTRATEEQRKAEKAGDDAKRFQKDVDQAKLDLSRLGEAKARTELLSDSQRLAELSSTQLQSNPELATLLGVASLRSSASKEGVVALRRALAAFVPKRSFDGTELCFGFEGRRFYFKDSRGEGTKLIEVDTRTWRRKQYSFRSFIDRLICSPANNDVLAVAETEIWRLSDGVLSRFAEIVPSRALLSVSIAPQGTVAAVLQPGTLHVLPLAASSKPQVLSSAYVSAALVSGTEMVAVDKSGGVFLVPLTSPASAERMGGGAETIEQVTPDGKLFVTRDAQQGGSGLWSFSTWHVERKARLGPAAPASNPGYSVENDGESCHVRGLETQAAELAWTCKVPKDGTVLPFPGDLAEHAVITADETSSTVWDPRTGNVLARLGGSPADLLVPHASGRFVAAHYGVGAGTAEPWMRYDLWDVFPRGLPKSVPYPGSAGDTTNVSAWLRDDGARALVWSSSASSHVLQSLTLNPALPELARVEETLSAQPDASDLCELTHLVSYGGGMTEAEQARLKAHMPPETSCLDVATAKGAIATSGTASDWVAYTLPNGDERTYRGLPDGPGKRSLALSPDGSTLAVSSSEQTALIDLRLAKSDEDVVEGQTARTIPGTRVKFNHEGDRLAAYVGDGSLILMERGDRGWLNPRVTLSIPMTSSCFGIAWRVDSKFVVTSNDDGVHVWDAVRGGEVWSLPGSFALATAFIGASQRIISFWQGGIRSDVCTLCLEPPGLIQEAAQRVTRNFTAAERAAFAVK